MNRIIVLLFALVVLLYQHSTAQKTKVPSMATPVSLKASAPASALAILPFDKITVWDYRFDTTKEGFILVKDWFRQLHFPSGAKIALEQTFNSMAQASVAPIGQELVLVLRTLWLRDIKAIELKEKRYADRQDISQCFIKADAYLYSNNSYQALVRIDTVFAADSFLINSSTSLIASAVNNIVQKLGTVDIETVKQKKNRYPADEIKRHYETPIRQSQAITAVTQKGLYLTFDDFLNNRVNERSFTVEADEQADYLYLEQDGKKVLFTEFWGFCEGGKKYIRVGYNFFPLTQDQNTYSFMGCEQAVHNSKPRNENRIGRFALFGVWGELHNSRLVNKLHPMQIDMLSGGVY